jgi:hypothetical protein
MKPSISNVTHQIDVDYYTVKGFEVLNAMDPTQYQSNTVL